MTYLVMECHPGYAVVLDQNGHFIKVANLNYQVGQTVSSVIQLHTESGETVLKKSEKYHYFFRYAASAAACLVLAAIGSWHLVLTPYGSLRMQINPDLRLNVNRLNYVISAEGLNLDGKTIIDGYQFKGRKILQAADELAQRAIDMGYLKEGGEIRISVESTHDSWKTKTEEEILLELENHTNHTITITSTELENEPSAPDTTETVIKETTPSYTVEYFDENDEDDWDDDDRNYERDKNDEIYNGYDGSKNNTGDDDNDTDDYDDSSDDDDNDTDDYDDGTDNHDDNSDDYDDDTDGYDDDTDDYDDSSDGYDDDTDDYNDNYSDSSDNNEYDDDQDENNEYDDNENENEND